MGEDVVESVSETYDRGPFRIYLLWRPDPELGWLLLAARFLPMWYGDRDNLCRVTFYRVDAGGERQALYQAAFSSLHAEAEMSGGPHPLERGYEVAFNLWERPIFRDRRELLVSVGVTMDVRGDDPSDMTTTRTCPPYTAREVAEALGLDYSDDDDTT